LKEILFVADIAVHYVLLFTMVWSIAFPKRRILSRISHHFALNSNPRILNTNSSKKYHHIFSKLTNTNIIVVGSSADKDSDKFGECLPVKTL